MKRTYEIMLVLDPELSEEERTKILEKTKGIITKDDGKINTVDEWGVRKLAYEIRHKKEGYYIVLEFSGSVDLPEKLRREFNLNQAILRGIVFRKPA